MVELSVVMISKNQEWNIARLVESVLKETSTIQSKEIVLVDSASSDHTAEIAARYPIRVLKLCAEQRLTAAAGRYVGYTKTTGELVLFLDGDMELCRGWLDKAIHVLHSHTNAAAITGKVIDQPKLAILSSEELDENSSNEAIAIINVRHGGGAAMYRRSVLEQVGTFNPYLYADEEPELCLRIRHAGYRILQLCSPIAYHYSVPFYTFSTFLNKRSHNYFLGYGQNIRYFLGTPLIWCYLKERGWALAPFFALCIGVFSAVITWLTGEWIWFLFWIALLILLVIGTAIRKRSLRYALLILFRRFLILEGTIRGFLLKPYDPASYPGKHEVI